jgi:hypothetical protein
MMRVVEASGDPVELTGHQALELADVLRALAARISN